MSAPDKPFTRKEMFYDGILTGNAVPQPVTREEMYLAEIAENGVGGTNVDLSNYYTKSQTDNLISEKVDKVEGMGLSENNFTNAEKSRLSEAYEQTILNRNTLGYSRKNLLENTSATVTKYGLTYTKNADGSVTVNGTATQNVIHKIGSFEPSEKSRFILSGAADGSTSNGYNLQIRRNNSAIMRDFGNGAELETGEPFDVAIYVNGGTVCDSAIFRPMLRNADISDNSYEQYKPSVVEYIASLEVRINALEVANQEVKQ